MLQYFVYCVTVAFNMVCLQNIDRSLGLKKNGVLEAALIQGTKGVIASQIVTFYFSDAYSYCRYSSTLWVCVNVQCITPMNWSIASACPTKSPRLFTVAPRSILCCHHCKRLFYYYFTHTTSPGPLHRVNLQLASKVLQLRKAIVRLSSLLRILSASHHPTFC